MEPFEDDDDFTGRSVGHYSIVALIATGGQGQVYRGRDERLRRDVAIKVLRAPRAVGPIRRLIDEARALSLVNHPHIAGIYDFITQGRREYIVMEYVPGATLRDILASGPLPASEVARLGAQVARGLAAAHAAHIIHRDIKPANLKVTSAGVLKVLDFGVAQLMPDGVVADATVRPSQMVPCGTVGYMAPEQLRGDPCDERSDIFSAGVVLYEMATGCAAFHRRNIAALVEAVQSRDPAPPTLVNPHLPVALEAIILKAMQKALSARHQSAVALAASLERLLHSRRAPLARVDPSSWDEMATVAP